MMKKLNINLLILKKKVTMNYKKIRDHCHYTGKYRGAAHSLCNLRYLRAKGYTCYKT